MFRRWCCPCSTPTSRPSIRRRELRSSESMRKLPRSWRGHTRIILSSRPTRDDVLAGMLEMRQNNHVALLFVAEPFQRQGFSRGLLGYAIDHVRREGGALERVTVNSSLYGSPRVRGAGVPARRAPSGRSTASSSHRWRCGSQKPEVRSQESAFRSRKSSPDPKAMLVDQDGSMLGRLDQHDEPANRQGERHQQDDRP